MGRLTIHAVPALKDNYVYVVADAATGDAAIVDPGEAAPVTAELERRGLSAVAIWCTHHHPDHVAAVPALAARAPGVPGVPVLGSMYDMEHGRIAGQTRGLADGETFAFAGVEVRAMHIPGHTLGHVAFLAEGNVFPGDTLFGAGCGRLFEGTPEMMVASLARLRELPDETRVWCGHEYTRHLLRFAVSVLPDDQAIRARLARAMAAPQAATVPLTIGEERATNPFLRWDDARLWAWAGVSEPVAAFAALRRAKDAWKDPGP